MAIKMKTKKKTWNVNSIRILGWMGPRDKTKESLNLSWIGSLTWTVQKNLFMDVELDVNTTLNATKWNVHFQSTLIFHYVGNQTLNGSQEA